MSVLINTIVKGQTAQGYDQVLTVLQELISKSPGFVLHCAYPANDEWNVMEIWNSKQEADDFFSRYVAPNIPKGIVPKRKYTDLHALVTPVA